MYVFELRTHCTDGVRIAAASAASSTYRRFCRTLQESVDRFRRKPKPTVDVQSTVSGRLVDA